MSRTPDLLVGQIWTIYIYRFKYKSVELSMHLVWLFKHLHSPSLELSFISTHVSCLPINQYLLNAVSSRLLTTTVSLLSVSLNLIVLYESHVKKQFI